MNDQPEIQSPLRSKRSIEEDRKLYQIPPKQDHKASFTKLIIVSILCAIFITGEIVGGVLSHSISVISDATHLITDLIGFILSFVFLYYSNKIANDKKSFGFHRLEIIGALANLFIIWIVAVFLVVESTSRIINKQFVEQPTIMLIVACGGLLVNIGMYFILHSGGGHSHGLGQECSHGHSHDHQKQQKAAGFSLNISVVENSLNDSDTNDQSQQDPQSLAGYQKHVDEDEHKHEHPHTVDHKHAHAHPKGHKNLRLDLKNLHPQKSSHDSHEHNHQESHDHNHDHDHKEGCSHDHQQSNNHGHSHDHKHDHDSEQDCSHQGHHHSHNKDKNDPPISMKAAILHAVTDIIQSVGLVIASLVIFFLGSDNGAKVTEFNAWHYLDPITTYIFSFLVVYSTWPITKLCFNIILESTPQTIQPTAIRNEFRNVPEVLGIHDFHVWQLKPGKIVLTAHVSAAKGRERATLRQLTRICRRNKIYHSTIQVEQHDLLGKEGYIRCDNDID